ncbi:hypothetical protein SAMN04489806_1992 [Paramicrobacterium humi]|uniref:Uncharacterized protein n=1 Tax=Paramicrobacterium humi TaxID=640635 RepID=A0A1H4MV84_9MICO|nr:hypothetical protein SAMN04489806_1992 [Microbacterium humi]
MVLTVTRRNTAARGIRPQYPESMTESTATDQSVYEVRFDWGMPGSMRSRRGPE